MEEEVYQEFDWSTPDENPMYLTGEGSELTAIKFSGTFDEVRKQSRKILSLTGTKMSVNNDAILLGMDDSMLDKVGSMIVPGVEELEDTDIFRDRLFHEIECFRQSGEGFGHVLDLSSQKQMKVCEYLRVHEHVDPQAKIGECGCGAIVSVQLEDKELDYDTLISFCGLQTYQRWEQREILIDIVNLSKNLLIVQGPLRPGDEDVSVEINFIIPNVKMVKVGSYFLWYYNSKDEQREKEKGSEESRQTAFKTSSGDLGWDESEDLKRVVLVGISNHKCIGIVDSGRDVERCLIDTAIRYYETIPEALSRGLLDLGCGDLSYNLLGVIHPKIGESQIFVYGSYDDRINQRGYVKFDEPTLYVGQVKGKRSKTGHLMKVLNLLVQMKLLSYSMATINQNMPYAYRVGDGGVEDRFASDEWKYHESAGRVSVHMVERVSENDVIRCGGNLIQRYKPNRIDLRSGNQIIGKAYLLEDNLYTVGSVIDDQYVKKWCDLSESVKLVNEGDDFYTMAKHYLKLSDTELKRGFLLMRGLEGGNLQRKCSMGKSIFKKCPGNLEATETLWQELIQDKL